MEAGLLTHDDVATHTPHHSRPAHRLAIWSLMLTLPLTLGIVIGVICGRTGGGIGYDQLSDFMGGFGVGAICGVIIALLLPRYLSRRSLHVTAGIAAATVAMLAVYVIVRAQNG